MQDFNQRIVVVVRKDLPGWQMANAVAHVSAYLGNKLAEQFGTGEFFTTKDGKDLPRNSQYPIIIKSADSGEQLKPLFEEVQTSGMVRLAFIREMIDFESDDELQAAVGQKNVSDIELLAVGIFGENEEVKRLTKKFGLWK
jgi:hypothetical protein